jgi:hypothetical protein
MYLMLARISLVPGDNLQSLSPDAKVTNCHYHVCILLIMQSVTITSSTTVVAVIKRPLLPMKVCASQPLRARVVNVRRFQAVFE